MRSAETILSIIRKRGQRGLPVTDAYRLLYQRDLYLRAYGKLYRNKGAMSPGVTPETDDGMSLEKIETIIQALTGTVSMDTSATHVRAQKERQTAASRPANVVG